MHKSGVNDQSPLLRYRLDSREQSFEAVDEGGNHEFRGSGQTRHLTTFFGVFVPCVLSMFSVILFLRVGKFAIPT